MKTKLINKNGSGAALLVVLFLIMVITIISTGFIAQSDVELACGDNMTTSVQIDSLVRSGLEHAKGLILNPQDADGWYWQGDTNQQLAGGGDDYYDVNVVQAANLQYSVQCDAYRLNGGERIAERSLAADVRLDPFIAYWQSAAQYLSSRVNIDGDVYFGDSLANYAAINGDVYGAKSITNYGSITGSRNSYVTLAPVTVPAISYQDFDGYYYIGSDMYTVGIIGSSPLVSATLGPTAGNPAGIYYYDGSIDLKGSININGMLVVKSDLKICENAVVNITAVKNFPAIVVGHDLSFENLSTSLTANGFVKVDNHIDMRDKFGASLTVNGALYVLGNGIMNTAGCSVSIVGNHQRAALQVWPSAGVPLRWSPAAGAIFKNIERVE